MAGGWGCQGAMTGRRTMQGYGRRAGVPTSHPPLSRSTGASLGTLRPSVRSCRAGPPPSTCPSSTTKTATMAMASLKRRASLTQKTRLVRNVQIFNAIFCTACEEGQGICAHLLVVVSVILIFLTMPFSLCLVVKVVQVGPWCCDGNRLSKFPAFIALRTSH